MQDERPFQESMEVCTSVTSLTRFVLQLADISAAAVCARIDGLSQVPRSHHFFFFLRECVKRKCIWVKTDQLQPLIWTSCTGHWLNHRKEHGFVGVKGNPQGFNQGLDCDVLVGEVHSTSHKPDEIYVMIETILWHAQDWVIWTTTQRAAQLDHPWKPSRWDPPSRTKCGCVVQAKVSRWCPLYT